MSIWKRNNWGSNKFIWSFLTLEAFFIQYTRFHKMKAINWILIYVYDFFWSLMIISDFTGISLIKRNKNLHCSALLLIIWFHYCIDCYKIQSNFMKKYRREKWILKAKKGAVAKHFVLFLPWWKIKKNAWKASSMVTPLFRAGDEASMIRNPVWKTELGEPSQSRLVASSRRVPSSRRTDFCRLIPRPEGRGYRKCRPSGGKRFWNSRRRLRT